LTRIGPQFDGHLFLFANPDTRHCKLHGEHRLRVLAQLIIPRGNIDSMAQPEEVQDHRIFEWEKELAACVGA
jgi:hypothetical protein